MPTISVIIPIYKVEPYLRRCVDSVLQQTFSDFEVILVDDGSPDNCPQICDEYAALDSRVRVIHQKNGGLSAARNAGMKIANGEYYTFIDSDDYVVDGYLEKLWKLLSENDAEVSVCGMTWFSEQDDLIALPDFTKQEELISVISGREMCFKIYDREMFPSAGGKLYRAELFDGIGYPEGKLFEDQGTTPIVLHRAGRVVISNYPGYRYFLRQGSISHPESFSPKVFDNIDGFEICMTYFRTINDREMLIRAGIMRDVYRARYNMEARAKDCRDAIPKKYYLKETKALAMLHKYCTTATFTSCIYACHPLLALPFRLEAKLLRLLRRKSKGFSW